MKTLQEKVQFLLTLYSAIELAHKFRTSAPSVYNWRDGMTPSKKFQRQINKLYAEEMK